MTTHGRTGKKVKTRKILRNIVFCSTLVVFGLVVFTLAELLYSKPAVPKYSGPVEKISTGIVGEYSSLSIIAKEKGYFRDYGLDVTIKDYVSGPPAIADVLKGTIDTATAADFVGVSNSFHGEDLRILATQLRTESFFLVVRHDHEIAMASDLKGKKIGVTAKTAGEFYLGRYLILNQLALSDITVVYASPTELVDQITSGQLDAIVTFDPHIHNTQRALGKNVSVWSLQNDQKLSSLFYGSGKLVRERPDAVKRYLQALAAAEDFAVSNNDEARNIVGNYLKLDDAYMRIVWARLTFGLSLDQDTLIGMEDQARWAIENKKTDATKVPDYLKIIYFDGLEAAKPDAITIIR